MIKSNYLLLALLSLSWYAKAQIPNNGFENWTFYGNGYYPNAWWSPNDSIDPGGNYFPISRSDDHYPNSVGNYSIRISNNTSLLPDWGGLGICWPGNWNGNNAPSFALTGHPNSLCGYYKFLPQNGDSMRIFIALYYQGVEITQGEWTDSVTISEWTPFVIPFPTYDSADSARIMLSSFDADAFQIHGNSVLYIDNLSFDNLISSSKELLLEKPVLSVFPNPANEQLIINHLPIEDHGLYSIYDSRGNLIETHIYHTNQVTLNTIALSNGLYFLVVNSSNNVCTTTFVINR